MEGPEDPSRTSSPSTGRGVPPARKSRAKQLLLFPWDPARKGRGLFREAPVTSALALICFAIWIAAAFDGGTIGALAVETLLAYGAYCDHFIHLGDWERLLTAPLLHASFLHLYLNMLALLAIGPWCERRFGSVRFGLIIATSALGGSAALLLRPTDPSTPYVCVGFSGAVCGLLGALWLASRLEPSSEPLHPRRLGFALLLNLALGLVPFVSFAAHAGGMAAGLATAFFMRNAAGPVGRPLKLALAAIVAVFLAALGSVSADWPERRATAAGIVALRSEIPYGAPWDIAKYAAEQIVEPEPSGVDLYDEFRHPLPPNIAAIRDQFVLIDERAEWDDLEAAFDAWEIGRSAEEIATESRPSDAATRRRSRLDTEEYARTVFDRRRAAWKEIARLYAEAQDSLRIRR